MELKFHDLNMFLATTTAGASNISTTGVMVPLSGISQGDHPYQRTGVKLNPRSLKLDMAILPSGDTYNSVRVTAFRWFDNANPTSGDIFNGVGYANFVNAPYLWVGKPKFKVLFDTKLYSNSADNQVKYIRKKITLPKGASCKYNGANSTDQESGNIWLFICSDSILPDNPVARGYSRLTFYDL